MNSCSPLNRYIENRFELINRRIENSNFSCNYPSSNIFKPLTNENNFKEVKHRGASINSNHSVVNYESNIPIQLSHNLASQRKSHQLQHYLSKTTNLYINF